MKKPITNDKRIERLEIYLMQLMANVCVLADITVYGTSDVPPEDFLKGIKKTAKNMKQLLSYVESL